MPDMSSTVTEDRMLYGYRLRTDLPLASLPPAVGDGLPEIELRFGEVSQNLDAPIWRSPFIEIGTDGDVLMRLGDHTCFLVREGREVIVNEAAVSHMADVETFLLGAVSGVLLHQRSDLALHASCVASDGRAVAIVGPSGRGKSTLAAALAARGATLLTDDVCRILFEGRTVLTVPGSCRLRLWPDAARTLDHVPETLPTGRSGHPKRILELSSGNVDPVPLAAIVRLGVDTRLDVPTLTRLSGPTSVMPAEDMLYRARLGRRLGRRIELFQGLTRLAALVPVFSLIRTGNVADLPDLVGLVESIMKGN
jgi:hypothetical protein